MNFNLSDVKLLMSHFRMACFCLSRQYRNHFDSRRLKNVFIKHIDLEISEKEETKPLEIM